MDSPILGRSARPALLPSGNVPRPEAGVDPAQNSREAVLPLAACRSQSSSPWTSSGAGRHPNELQLSEIQDKIVCPKIERERQYGAFSQEKNADSEERASLQTDVHNFSDSCQPRFCLSL